MGCSKWANLTGSLTGKLRKIGLSSCPTLGLPVQNSYLKNSQNLLLNVAGHCSSAPELCRAKGFRNLVPNLDDTYAIITASQKYYPEIRPSLKAFRIIFRQKTRPVSAIWCFSIEHVGPSDTSGPIEQQTRTSWRLSHGKHLGSSTGSKWTALRRSVIVMVFNFARLVCFHVVADHVFICQRRRRSNETYGSNGSKFFVFSSKSKVPKGKVPVPEPSIICSPEMPTATKRELNV